MTLRDFIKNNLFLLDGGTGTLLQAAGLPAGMPPEKWNVLNPDALIALHKAYYDAGSNAVVTNTFGINALKYGAEEINESVAAAVANAKKAMALSDGTQEKFVLLDLGPTGRLISPLGDLDFEDAVAAYVPVIKAGEKAGADGILIETMNECAETKAALLAVKENTDLPVIVSNAYGKDQRLLGGSTPDVMVAMLEGMGADAIGVNCSFGPAALLPVVERYLALSSIPVLMKPNAGMPRMTDGRMVYDVSPETFSREIEKAVSLGVRCVGGCCGTTPEYIRETAQILRRTVPVPIAPKSKTVVSSGIKAVDFDDCPVLIGERINPTGKKRLKTALAENDTSYILGEGIKQQERGAHVLDVNVGAPEIDEETVLVKTVVELQSVCDVPLQIDTSNFAAMERAMRRYIGKPLVNSVNGKKESMAAVFPLVKKYGGTVIPLTLDENGIPGSARERLAVAKKILDTAKTYGIDKKDVVFDPLALAVSTDKNAAETTLEAIRLIRTELGCHTSLGISNVSFGLPDRANVNSVFFVTALSAGLTAAIMNPFSEEMMSAYYAWRVLRGLDDNCLDFIAHAEKTDTDNAKNVAESEMTLSRAIEKGLKEQASAITDRLLVAEEPLQIINGQIIPALDRVGVGFENKTVFLPQLMMSAEAASGAFDRIKCHGSRTSSPQNGVKIVLATVRGDIHDIGKNIVRMLLENYGFSVIDLGKDVKPETIVDAVIENGAAIVGLSALMTTTVPAMAETITLLRQRAPHVKIVVGGAVLTREYAEKIGADFYAADAMETVRFAEKISAAIK